MPPAPPGDRAPPRRTALHPQPAETPMSTTPKPTYPAPNPGMNPPDRRAFLQGAVASAAALALPRWTRADAHPAASDLDAINKEIERSEERRVGKECRSRWSPYH